MPTFSYMLGVDVFGGGGRSPGIPAERRSVWLANDVCQENIADESTKTSIDNG